MSLYLQNLKLTVLNNFHKDWIESSIEQNSILIDLSPKETDINMSWIDAGPNCSKQKESFKTQNRGVSKEHN